MYDLGKQKIQMEIVVTDGYALNPGDLNWKSIEAFGELKVFDRTPSNQVAERCKSADIILSNKTEINKEIISNLPQLKLISVLATGYNIIDVIAAKSRGIPVCNVPAYGTQSVAQHAFALILMLSNRTDVHTSSVAKGEWVKSLDWSYSKTPLIELLGKTLGIVGMGSIGEQTARIANAFGMKVLYYNRRKKSTDLGEYSDLTSLFSKSDFISLHCPLTADNKEFVDAALLKTMKPSAFIVNTARGQLINEQDLANALNDEQIAGAALDVLSKEPPPSDNPLLKARNCFITPHNAWSTKEARQRIMTVTAENIKAFLDGHPKNIVNA
jgi:glycerate dehydrogenase